MPKKKGNLESGRIMDDWQITLCIDVIGDVWYYDTELQLFCGEISHWNCICGRQLILREGVWSIRENF